MSLFSTFDGKYIVTVGESDYAVHMWSLHPDVLDEQILQAGTEESVFVQMIPGAREGDFYKDLEDYFYYAQLRR